MQVKALKAGDRRPWNRFVLNDEGKKVESDIPVTLTEDCWVLLPEDDVEAEYAPCTRYQTELAARRALGRLHKHRARNRQPQRAN